MTYFFLTVVKIMNAAVAAVRLNATAENVTAADFKAFDFFNYLKMIIQRFLTFKTLIMFFFHES